MTAGGGQGENTRSNIDGYAGERNGSVRAPRQEESASSTRTAENLQPALVRSPHSESKSKPGQIEWSRSVADDRYQTGGDTTPTVPGPSVPLATSSLRKDGGITLSHKTATPGSLLAPAGTPPQNKSVPLATSSLRKDGGVTLPKPATPGSTLAPAGTPPQENLCP